jgi:PLP dependent protein
MSEFPRNLGMIKDRIDAAALKAGRRTAHICLVAVSKGHNLPSIECAIAAGQKIFGENRVQEAHEKFSALKTLHADLELHMIGTLQTNKIEQALSLFDVIETVDRPHLVQYLSRAIRKSGRIPRLYVQVNIGREPQKSGVIPDKLGEFLDLCREKNQLNISGLMCIPPHKEDPQPYFIEMKKLADRYDVPTLSMGMSADFETAIHCGATDVRIGTALFGPR